MKKRELTEVRKESVEKLLTKVSDLKLDLMKKTMKSLGKEEKNTKVAKKIKQDIAQILTVITEKQKTK